MDLLLLAVDVEHWSALGCHFCEQEWLKCQNPGWIYALNAVQDNMGGITVNDVLSTPSFYLFALI